MDSTATDPTQTDAPRAGRRGWRGGWRSWTAFTLGLALLGAAAYAVVRSGADLGDPIETLRAAPLWLKALVIVSPAANLLCVTMCFHALQRRFAPVPIVEMGELIGSAWLLNHLPMRPGLVGRIGYHKRVHGIRVRDSVGTTVWSVALAGAANAALVVVALVMPGAGDRAPWSWAGSPIAWVAAPSAMAFAAALFVPRGHARLIVLALGWRSLDVVVWYLRYGLAFSILGIGLPAPMIALISAVSQLVSLVPFTGSGLGFREWGVGLSADAGGAATSAGIAADLLNRAAELIVVIPVGLWCSWRLSARMLARRRAARSAEDQTHGAPDAQDRHGDDAQEHPSDRAQR